MAEWLDDIQKAFRNLGGVAKYSELYEEVGKVRGHKLTIGNQASTRERIQMHSSDSAMWKKREKKRPDLFFSVEGLGNGVWGLREAVAKSNNANDLAFEGSIQGNAVPDRKKFETYRIIRDNELSRALKIMHRHKCQICELQIALANGTLYSEVHHIRPIGKPHNGPDVINNLIVVCPTCHVRLDYFSMELSLDKIFDKEMHNIDSDYIEYHNDRYKSITRNKNTMQT